MKYNREKATRLVRFLIALALATAGFWVFTLCISTTAMATDADTIEQQASSIDAQKTMVPEAVVPETQEIDVSVLEEQVSEIGGQSAEQRPMPMDSEQSSLDEQKQQFLSRQIFFAFNSCRLDEQAQAQAREQAAWLAANPDVSVEIIGYCDQSGPQEYNIALGEKRANAVKTFLENLGIVPQRLTEVSYGEKSPVRTTTDQAVARINRRVEFKIQPAA